MSPVLADGLGLVGSAAMVAAYAYSNIARRPDLLAFNIVNLSGSLLVIVSLLKHFNLPAFLLEVAWSLIAGAGIVRGLLRRRRA